MSEFKKKKPKVNLTVRVDPEIKAKAKKKKLHLSSIVEHSLKMAIDGKFIEAPEGA